MSHAEAIVAGHLFLDIVQTAGSTLGEQVEDLCLPGLEDQIDHATVTTAGVVSNTGLALKQLGIDTRLIGKVGQDSLGEMARAQFKSYAEDLDQDLLLGDQHTGYTLHQGLAGQEKSALRHAGVNDQFKAADIDYDQLDGVRVFHFADPPSMKSMYKDNGAELISMFRNFKHHLITTSLDMSMPKMDSQAAEVDWLSLLQGVLPYVDIFLPSLEEIMFMMRPEQYRDHLATHPGEKIQVSIEQLRELADEMIEMGVAISGIKLGSRGFYLKTTENLFELQKFGKAAPSHYLEWLGYEIYAPCYEVEVMGTTGAGDTAYAGFLAAVLKDMTLEEAVAAAAAVGASTCETQDVISGIKPWEETWKRINSGWKRKAPSLAVKDMELHEDTGVWLNISE